MKEVDGKKVGKFLHAPLLLWEKHGVDSFNPFVVFCKCNEMQQEQTLIKRESIKWQEWKDRTLFPIHKWSRCITRNGCMYWLLDSVGVCSHNYDYNELRKGAIKKLDGEQWDW